MVQTVVFASLGTGTALHTDITSGIFDRFRSLPIARWRYAPTGTRPDRVASARVLVVIGIFAEVAELFE